MIVYLAGPITGRDREGSETWRDQFREELVVACNSPRAADPYGFELISPLRGHSHTGTFGPHGEEHVSSVWKHPKAEFHRDVYDVRRADVVVANVTGAERASVGTCMELGVAVALNKFVIVVIPEEERSKREPGRGTTQSSNPHDHLFIYKAASVVLETTREAADIVALL